jgi:cyclic pyranopterin monophosphate synthase
VPELGSDTSPPGESPREAVVASELPTHQSATARASVAMNPATARSVARSEVAKGDVLGCARIAGIQASKRAAELIPSVLPTRVGGVVINFEVREDRIDIESRVDAFDRMGVSMEALTACAVAALTIYDMCKAIDRSMTIGALALWEATAGEGVSWRRDASAEAFTNL